MKNKYYIIFVCATILMFTACQFSGTAKALDNKNPLNTPVYTPTPTPVAQTLAQQPIKIPQTMYYYDDTRKPAKYEPASGTYLGAYILADENVGYDIKEFEQSVQSTHAIYVYNLNLGEPFPTEWALTCVANVKTPYFIINLPDKMDASQFTALDEMATSFSELKIPMFLSFSSNQTDISPDKFKENWQQLSKIFKEKAPNIAIVWNVDLKDVYTAMDYYPGDLWTDWVGVKVMETLATSNEEGGADAKSSKLYAPNVLENLDIFYYKFQKLKPIMLSIGVSHISSANYAYETNAAAAEITRVYDAIKEDYAQIKAVVYFDFNGLRLATNKNHKDDFTITTEDKIKDNYTNVTLNQHFLGRLTDQSSKKPYEKQKVKLRSPFKAYEISGDYYVSQNSLSNDFYITEFASFPKSMIINGEQFYCTNGSDIEDDIEFED